MTLHPDPQWSPPVLKDAIGGMVNAADEISQATYLGTATTVNSLLRKLRPGESGGKYNEGRSMNFLKRLAWDRPSNAVLRRDGTNGASCQCCHPDEDRRLTIAELKRVGSFPDPFAFPAGLRDNMRWQQIGNSVPPLMMLAIARHVRRAVMEEDA